MSVTSQTELEAQLEQETQRVRELSDLIQSKWPAYKVTHEWNIDTGYDLTIENENKPEDKRQFVISREVVQDWTPKQIMTLLDANNWMLVLGVCRGKTIPRLTNKGWA